MNSRVRFAALVVAAAVPLTGLSAGVASAENIGQQGCTPGYWKNHTDNWEEYRPTSLVRWVFSLPASHPYAQTTLLDALKLRGGPGVDGATQILLRAASAAVLNAAHEGLGYPYRRYTQFQVISKVQDALASGDRKQILDLATTLDEANNLGCPLN
jgi:hypothetical protein